MDEPKNGVPDLSNGAPSALSIIIATIWLRNTFYLGLDDEYGNKPEQGCGCSNTDLQLPKSFKSHQYWSNAVSSFLSRLPFHQCTIFFDICQQLNPVRAQLLPSDLAYTSECNCANEVNHDRMVEYNHEEKKAPDKVRLNSTVGFNNFGAQQVLIDSLTRDSITFLDHCSAVESCIFQYPFVCSIE